MIAKLYKKIIRKSMSYFIKKKYKINGKISLIGKAYIDNPNIIFGNNVTIYQGVQIWGNGNVEIGNNVAIGKDTIIFSASSIKIEDDVSIAAQCYIIDCDHEFVRSKLINKQKLETQPVFIGEDSWIGAGSKILKGSHISKGSVIGALSLVNGLTEPYSINVGIPIREIGIRKDD